MDKITGPIPQTNTLLKTFQRVFNDPEAGKVQHGKKPGSKPESNEISLNSANPVKSFDIKFYSGSGEVSSVNPGSKGMRLDLNV